MNPPSKKLRDGIPSKLLLIVPLLFAGLVPAANGQSLSLALASASGSPGSQVSVNITLGSNGGPQPATLQWTVNYSQYDFSSVQVSAGAAAGAVGKQLFCQQNIGSVSCLLQGPNASQIPAGVVATLTMQISPSTNSPSSLVQLVNAGASASDGSAITIGGSTGIVTISGGSGSSLSGLSCNPASIVPPSTTVCTINLASPAPVGGIVVSVASNNSLLQVPASVVVSAGASSASFTATAYSGLSSAVQLTATLGVSSQIFVLATGSSTSQGLAGLTCNSAAPVPPASITCTVSLSTPAPPGGTAVAMSSNNSLVQVPSVVIVSAGASSAAFTVNVAAGLAATVQLTASLGSSSQIFLLNAGSSSSSGLNGLSCNPNSLMPPASTVCTVSLSVPAPAGGVLVAIASNNSLVQVPSSVFVSAGAYSSTFTATALSGLVATVQLTASLGTSSQTFLLAVGSSSSFQGVAGLNCSPGSPVPPAIISCTVTLTAPAPVGGIAVSLSSSSTLLQVPTTLIVSSGASGASFSANVPVGLTTSVQLTASLGSSTQTFVLTIGTASQGLAGFSCSPTSLVPPATAYCTVTLSAPASTGVSVLVTSNSPSLTVPQAVTISAGSVNATFAANSATVQSALTVQLTASLNGVPLTFNITLSPSQIVSQSILPQFVFGGGWYTAIYFTNTNTSAVTVPVQFAANDGTPLFVPSVGGPSTTVSIAPRGTAIIEALNAGNLSQGYAVLSLPAGVLAYGVFRESGNAGDQEAVVPISGVSATTNTLIWDDTSFNTGVAIVNPSSTGATLTITLYDNQGANIGNASMPLPAGTKIVSQLRDLSGLGGVIGRRGSAVFTVSAGNVAVLGLRFDGSAFTSIPTASQ